MVSGVVHLPGDSFGAEGPVAEEKREEKERG